LDPSLLVLEKLKSKQIDDLRAVFNALSIHRHNLIKYNAEISMTEQYMFHVIESLNSSNVDDRDLINLIRELLGRTVRPQFSNANIKKAGITPDIFRSWVDNKTKDLWLDCLIASLFQKFQDGNVIKAELENFIATFPGPTNVDHAIVINDELGELTGGKVEWRIKLLTCDIDWAGYIASLSDWPQGLEKELIELFAYRNFNLSTDEISRHRQVKFSRSCLREIREEADLAFRNSIVEVVSCRAYDRLSSQHRDHKINDVTRRVDINKMNPPARLHYKLEQDLVVFTMYENREHDRGLK
jgi:hypothetical protein